MDMVLVNWFGNLQTCVVDLSSCEHPAWFKMGIEGEGTLGERESLYYCG